MFGGKRMVWLEPAGLPLLETDFVYSLVGGLAVSNYLVEES